jgi:glycosyltransferase involved in cell wall biosynthesis
MRILVITNFYPPQVVGGYERSIADFSRHLHQRRHHILVLTSNLESPFSSKTESAEEPTVWRELRACGGWTEQGLAWLPPEQAALNDEHNRQLINQVLKDFQPQVCLAGNIDLLGIGLLEHLIAAGVPVAHYVMNETPNYPCDMAPHSPLHRYLTCSNWVLQNMQQLGYPMETAEVVYPGAAVEEFYQAELPARDRLRIAYASLVMHYKGADVLVEAICLLHAAGIEFTATIAGGTLYPKYVELLQEMIESEGLQEQVKFVGVLSRPELIDLYKSHNVLVFPSRFQEPFGISQIEAMAAGLTLVTSGTGGAKEIVEHAQDGLLFESENPLDLADMLSSLAAHPSEWEAITHKGQQKAMTQFNQRKSVEKLEAVLHSLVSSNI